MDESVFREKSLEKVKSPDHLDEYIHIANPGVWALLISIALLLVGLCIWGVFGQVRTVIQTNALCQDGSVVCLLTDDQVAKVEPGDTATVDGKDAVVAEVNKQDNNQSTCTLTVSQPLEDGTYDVRITVESIRPLSFLTN